MVVASAGLPCSPSPAESVSDRFPPSPRGPQWTVRSEMRPSWASKPVPPSADGNERARREIDGTTPRQLHKDGHGKSASMNKRLLISATGAIVTVLVFLAFFRYAYLHDGARLVRVDRLTGNSCYLPCAPSTTSSLPTSVSDAGYAIPPVGDEEHRERSQALALVRSREDARALEVAFRNRRPSWSANTDYDWAQGMGPFPGFCPHVVYVHLHAGTFFDGPTYTWTVDLDAKSVNTDTPAADANSDSVSTMIGTTSIRVAKTCPDGKRRSE